MAKKTFTKLLFFVCAIVFPLSGMAATPYTDNDLKNYIGDYLADETGTKYARFVDEVKQWTALDRKARNINGSNGVDMRVFNFLKTIPNLNDIVTGGTGILNGTITHAGTLMRATDVIPGTTLTYNDNMSRYIADKNVGFRVTREDDNYTSAVTLVINGDLPATGPVISLWPHFDTVVDSSDKNPDGTPIVWKYDPVTKTAIGPAVGDSTASCVMTLFMVDMFAKNES